jgi:hypothetical protein
MKDIRPFSTHMGVANLSVTWRKQSKIINNDTFSSLITNSLFFFFYIIAARSLFMEATGWSREIPESRQGKRTSAFYHPTYLHHNHYQHPLLFLSKLCSDLCALSKTTLHFEICPRLQSPLKWHNKNRMNRFHPILILTGHIRLPTNHPTKSRRGTSSSKTYYVRVTSKHMLRGTQSSENIA